MYRIQSLLIAIVLFSDYFLSNAKFTNFGALSHNVKIIERKSIHKENVRSFKEKRRFFKKNRRRAFVPTFFTPECGPRTPAPLPSSHTTTLKWMCTN